MFEIGEFMVKQFKCSITKVLVKKADAKFFTDQIGKILIQQIIEDHFLIHETVDFLNLYIFVHIKICKNIITI